MRYRLVPKSVTLNDLERCKFINSVNFSLLFGVVRMSVEDIARLLLLYPHVRSISSLDIRSLSTVVFHNLSHRYVHSVYLIGIKMLVHHSICHFCQ